MRSNRPRQANLLGAAVLAVVDRLGGAVSQPDSRNLNSAAALMRIGRRPGQTIEFLARTLGLSHSTTVRVVDRLEESALVERRAGVDNRSLALFPTKAGERLATDAHRRRLQALEATLAPLSAEERRQLTSLLEKLLRGLTMDRWSARHTCRLCHVPSCSRPQCPVEGAIVGGSECS